jgi:hypothetical protein
VPRSPRNSVQIPANANSGRSYYQTYIAEGQQQLGLQQLGWTDGRNVRIDIRWGEDDADHERAYRSVRLCGEDVACEALEKCITRSLPSPSVRVKMGIFLVVSCGPARRLRCSGRARRRLARRLHQ